MKVPIKSGSVVVEITSLPAVQESIVFLNKELPPLSYWIELAVSCT
jgi:hypothetical protein